jgi:hypothetical protein
VDERQIEKLQRDNTVYDRENKKLVKEYHRLLKKHKRLLKDHKKLQDENDRNKRLLKSKEAELNTRPPRGGWSIGRVPPGNSGGWR